MSYLHPTVAKLSRLNLGATGFAPGGSDGRLSELTEFGSNPGALRALTYLPDDLPAGAPLVVVLHGCTQTAAGYDRGAGWSQLADELGFALLFPEQQRANNPNLCFNWFVPIDSRRSGGEAQSIGQMIARMTARHDLDEARVFVTGLSAGGAMASIMLATYPEVFSAGAIIAGLPFGCAASVAEAFMRMSGQGYPSDGQLGDLVRQASDHRGPWPDISIWHGEADATVAPANAERIAGQWLAVHGIADKAGERDSAAGHSRRCWRDGSGRLVIESYTIAGMGHGTPIKSAGPDACGIAAPHMLDVGISSTRQIARSWGLAEAAPAAAARPARAPAPDPAPREPAETAAPAPAAWAGTEKRNVKAIIEDALRAAGLMR